MDSDLKLSTWMWSALASGIESHAARSTTALPLSGNTSSSMEKCTTVSKINGFRSETVDLDVVCPGFRHRIARGTLDDGTPIVREYIEFHGKMYNRVEDQWIQI